jgi:mannan endo-1,4-beta-mannosidase
VNALKQISETGTKTVRILWRKYSWDLSYLDLDKVISEAISKNLVPMIELHDVTGSNDNNKLYEMTQWLADNVWLLIKYRKYLLGIIVD